MDAIKNNEMTDVEKREANREIQRKEMRFNSVLFELSNIVNIANKIEGLMTKDDKGEPFKRDKGGRMILPQHYEEPDNIDNRVVTRFSILVETHSDSTEEQKQESLKSFRDQCNEIAKEYF